jgi:endonuclease YncB( thermonuclease family)
MLRITSLLLLTLIPSAAQASDECLVVGVSDGDTMTVRCEAPTGTLRIRLHAIDAPETGQAFGQKSKATLAAHCFGQRVSVERQDVDRYGRIVASVTCSGQDAAALQVRQGMAWVYRRYAPADSPLFGEEQGARAARLGLWSEASPTPPWQWRRSSKSTPE